MTNEPVRNSRNYLLQPHASGQEQLDRINAVIDPLVPLHGITLTDLGGRPIHKLPAYLRSLNMARLYVLKSDQICRDVLPVLFLVSRIGFLNTAFFVVDADRKSRIGGIEMIISAARIAGAMFDGYVALLRSFAELAWLGRRPPVQPRWRAKGGLLFLLSEIGSSGRHGGAASHVVGVANALQSRLGNVILAASSRPSGLRDDVGHHRVPSLTATAFPSELNVYRKNLVSSRAVRRRFFKDDLSAIYTRMTLGMYAGVQASRKLKTPLITEYNGSEVWIANNWGRGLRFERLAEMAERVSLRHSHLIVTVSRALRDELIRKGVEPSRIVWHPNGVDTRIFDPDRFSPGEIERVRKRLGANEKAIVFTFTGSFGPWHGAETLADAIIRVFGDEPSGRTLQSFRFVLIGDGATRHRVEARLREAGCMERVTMTGAIPHEEMPIHLAASDVFLSPHVANADGSEFFGSPTKLFEYLAMARPVIASNLGQIGKVMEGSPGTGSFNDQARADYENAFGLLTIPGDAGDLAKAIRLVAENDAWRKSAGKTGRKLASESYSWDAHVSHVLDKLKDVSRAG